MANSLNLIIPAKPPAKPAHEYPAKHSATGCGACCCGVARRCGTMGARDGVLRISSRCWVYAVCRSRNVRRNENAGRMDHADDVDGHARDYAGQVDLCLSVDVAGNDDCHDATFVLADAGAV